MSATNRDDRRFAGIRAAVLLAALATMGMPAVAESAGESGPAWDVTKPRGATRTIDFTTTEGTGMSVDISPDGWRIAFVSDRGGQNNLWVMDADGAHQTCDLRPRRADGRARVAGGWQRHRGGAPFPACDGSMDANPSALAPSPGWQRSSRACGFGIVHRRRALWNA